jgi:hypothetical protein
MQSKEWLISFVLVPSVLDHHIFPAVQTDIRELKSRHFPRLEPIGRLLLGEVAGAEGQRVVSGENAAWVEAKLELLGALE